MFTCQSGNLTGNGTLTVSTNKESKGIYFKQLVQKLAFLTFIVCLGLPVYVIIAGAAVGVIFTAFVIVCVKGKIKRRSKSRNLQYNDKQIDAAPINKRPRSKESDVIEVDVCLPNTSHFIGPGVNGEDRTVTSSHGSQMTPRNEAYDGATVLPCTEIEQHTGK